MAGYQEFSLWKLSDDGYEYEYLDCESERDTMTDSIMSLLGYAQDCIVVVIDEDEMGAAVVRVVKATQFVNEQKATD